MGRLVDRPAVSVILGHAIFSGRKIFDPVVPEHHLDFERKNTRLPKLGTALSIPAPSPAPSGGRALPGGAHDFS
jgi:hypothetical protein